MQPLHDLGEVEAGEGLDGGRDVAREPGDVTRRPRVTYEHDLVRLG